MMGCGWRLRWFVEAVENTEEEAETADLALRKCLPNCGAAALGEAAAVATLLEANCANSVLLRASEMLLPPPSLIFALIFLLISN